MLTNDETSSSEVAMKVQGICHCGKITYAAEVDPKKVIVAVVSTRLPPYQLLLARFNSARGIRSGLSE